MSQHDLDIANQGFPATRADLNLALKALGSSNSGATAPSTTYANQLWYDTANNILKIRNEDNDAWISLLTLDQSADAVTQIDVDNIRIDGNTISSTNTNGNVIIDPAGTGDTIVASGNVGIGTSSPNANGKLTINAPTDNSPQIVFTENDTAKWVIGHRHDGDHFRFYDLANSAERLRIDSSGKVGIGTSVPASHSGTLAVVDSSVGSVAISGGTGGNEGSILRFQKGTTDKAFIGMNSAVVGGGSTSDGLTIENLTNSPTRFRNDGSESLRVDSSGHVLVGQTSVSTPGQGNTTVGGSFRGDGRVFLSASTSYSLGLNRNGDGELTNFSRSGSFVGSINVTSSSTSYNTASDHRLKEAVVDMTGAITRVKALAPKRFNFIADDSVTVDGFLAHEAQTVVPEAVSGTKDAMRDEEYIVNAATGDIYTPAAPATYDEDGEELTAATDEVIHSSDAEKPEEFADGQQWRETTAAVMGTRSVPDYQGIDQSKLVPLLTGALREAIAKIESLETRVAALEA